MPPPFRLTREMVEAMGGSDAPHYTVFKSLCCQVRLKSNLQMEIIRETCAHVLRDFDIGIWANSCRKTRAVFRELL